MKRRWVKLFATLIVCGASVGVVSAQSVVKVAAAANLRYSLSEIERLYESTHEGVDLQINYGASGTFYQQIINGAPYDLFLSADDLLPNKLRSEGVTSFENTVYASGKLALYGLQEGLSEAGLEIVSDSSIKRISVANPRTAPYGTRSVEILKAMGLWERVERKIVYGDSIAQAAQFALTGNCEVGFVALSLLLNPEVELKGSYYIIPEEHYQPISQAGVVLKEGGAEEFFEFMLGEECRAVWDRYGYSTME
ncbi:MAG: molybdate ABC transporter substrate-binding protein [Rikenellaceae bacterium]